MRTEPEIRFGRWHVWHTLAGLIAMPESLMGEIPNLPESEFDERVFMERHDIGRAWFQQAVQVLDVRDEHDIFGVRLVAAYGARILIGGEPEDWTLHSNLEAAATHLVNLASEVGESGDLVVPSDFLDLLLIIARTEMEAKERVLELKLQGVMN